MSDNRRIIVEEEVELDVPSEHIPIDENAQKVNEEQSEIVGGTETPKAKSFSKKALVTILFVLVNAVAILAVALMEFAGQESIEPFSNVWGIFKQNFVYGAIALVLFLTALLSEGLKRFVLLRASLNHKRLFWLSVSTAAISKYYDYITPLGTGGQPMEIYYMRKKGVPGAIASGITIVCYAIGLFANVFLTAVMLIWKGFLGVSAAIEVLAIVGLVANIIVPLGVVIFSVMPKVGDFIARAVTKILGFLHLAKNTETFRRKAVDSMKEYARCIKFFFSKYGFATFLVFFFGLCYNVSVYSIPYFVIRMCGVPAERVDFFEVFTLCLICFNAITIFPTPGNSGAAEISFHSIFSSYLSSLGAGVLFWGVISWRIATYYLFILSGVILMITEKIIGRKRTQDMQRNAVFETPPSTDEVAVEQKNIDQNENSEINV